MPNKITPDEFLTDIRKIKRNHYLKECDIEACHMEMDELMCKTLSSLGYGEGVKIFRNTQKWYG